MVMRLFYTDVKSKPLRREQQVLWWHQGNDRGQGQPTRCDVHGHRSCGTRLGGKGFGIAIRVGMVWADILPHADWQRDKCSTVSHPGGMRCLFWLSVTQTLTHVPHRRPPSITSMSPLRRLAKPKLTSNWGVCTVEPKKDAECRHPPSAVSTSRAGLVFPTPQHHYL